MLEFDAELHDGEPDFAALAQQVRSALIRKFSLPSVAVAFLVAGTLPRTASGKVRRSVTRGMLEKGELDLRYSNGFADTA